MKKARTLTAFIRKDLKKKMVFIGGPRQVGKTTFALMLAQEIAPESFRYFNWDVGEDRLLLRRKGFPADRRFLIFDEIHKYRSWRQYLKGLYDTHKDTHQILVTGSARLDLYRRGGDSLLGRYHYYRLHPFSLKELLDPQPSLIQPFQKLVFSRDAAALQTFRQLFSFGGFPEILLSPDATEHRRLLRERKTRLVQGDIRDIEQVHDLSGIEVLADMIPEKVGSLFSLNAVREDLEVQHKTAGLWMDILERFYYQFRIYPFTSRRVASLKKQPKVYLWDWSEIQHGAARLENMVASHLLKFVHFLEDTSGYRAELFFLRDKEGREVDFLVTVDRKPWFAVEVKVSTASSSTTHLEYFGKKLSIPFLFLISDEAQEDIIQDGTRRMSVHHFFSGLI